MDEVLFPSQFEISGERARVELRPLKDQSFAKSFLFEGLKLGTSTWIDLAEELQKREGHPQAMPAGFIFHIGKTGSVLASNMLNEIPGCVVLKEPDVLSQVFFRQHAQEPALIQDLRDIISLLGHVLAQFASRFVVKWSSWTALHLPVITEAFPNIPVCFLYRDPVEVLASNILKPSMWSSQGRLVNVLKTHLAEPLVSEQLSFAFKQEMAANKYIPANQFYVETLAKIFETLTNTDNDICLVNYTEMPEAAIDKIAPYFNLNVDAKTSENMTRHSRIHAHSFGKREQEFQPDSGRKRRLVSTGLQGFIEKEVFPRMQAMEAVHRS